MSRQIQALIRSTDRKIVEAQQALHRAERLHMDVSDAWQQLSQAQTLLTGTRDAQHTVIVKEVRKLLGRGSDAEKSINQTMMQAQAAMNGAHARRNTLLVMGVFILAVCFIIYGKWRQLTADWHAARSDR